MMSTTKPQTLPASEDPLISRRVFVGATGALLAARELAGDDRVNAQSAVPHSSIERFSERESLRAAKAAVKTAQKTILKISREVWNKPAVGLQEQEAMEVHIRELEAAGFTITSRNSGGHPTAFIAQWSQGSGGPKLGFLPEYDALPGLGNAAEPLVKPAENGRTDGHGCGHNCLGAGCTGAAMALKAMMLERNVAGTLRVYGCGAEENVGAKIFLAKAGLFDDLDAALAWHPAAVPVTGTFVTNANHFMRVSWKGRTAHAGMDPWSGRSALDAAELFAHGVNLMREHLEPTARLHYIYEIAGVAPNVVPDEARIWIQARDITTPRVNAITDWLAQLAEGAAGNPDEGDVPSGTRHGRIHPQRDTGQAGLRTPAEYPAGLDRRGAGVCQSLPESPGSERSRSGHAGGTDDQRREVRRIDRCGRCELEHAGRRVRLADVPAGGEPPHLGRHRVRRHVHRRQGQPRCRRDPGGGRL